MHASAARVVRRTNGWRSQADTNQDGILDASEVLAWLCCRSAAMRAKLELLEQNKAAMEVRLKNATGEISHWRDYEYVVINDDLDDAYDLVRSILRAERAKREREREKEKRKRTPTRTRTQRECKHEREREHTRA